MFATFENSLPNNEFELTNDDFLDESNKSTEISELVRCFANTVKKQTTENESDKQKINQILHDYECAKEQINKLINEIATQYTENKLLNESINLLTLETANIKNEYEKQIEQINIQNLESTKIYNEQYNKTKCEYELKIKYLECEQEELRTELADSFYIYEERKKELIAEHLHEQEKRKNQLKETQNEYEQKIKIITNQYSKQQENLENQIKEINLKNNKITWQSIIFKIKLKKKETLLEQINKRYTKLENSLKLKNNKINEHTCYINSLEFQLDNSKQQIKEIGQDLEASLLSIQSLNANIINLNHQNEMNKCYILRLENKLNKDNICSRIYNTSHLIHIRNLENKFEKQMQNHAANLKQMRAEYDEKINRSNYNNVLNSLYSYIIKMNNKKFNNEIDRLEINFEMELKIKECEYKKIDEKYETIMKTFEQQHYSSALYIKNLEEQLQIKEMKIVNLTDQLDKTNTQIKVEKTNNEIMTSYKNEIEIQDKLINRLNYKINLLNSEFYKLNTDFTKGTCILKQKESELIEKNNNYNKMNYQFATFVRLISKHCANNMLNNLMSYIPISPIYLELTLMILKDKSCPTNAAYNIHDILRVAVKNDNYELAELAIKKGACIFGIDAIETLKICTNEDIIKLLKLSRTTACFPEHRHASII